MADGLNQIRAMRVTEIMTDFRNILRFLTQIRTNPHQAEHNEEVYVVLRRCISEGSNLLNQPFDAQNASRGDDEQDRAHLRRIITDAAYRRFKAQKLYLASRAALRAVNARQGLLQGQQPNAGHARGLQAIAASFRAELATITDARVEQSLREQDVNAGVWLNEDPSLAVLQRMAAANGGGNGNRQR